MFDTMKVAQKIREARNGQNMTQMALADEMGVSYQAVSNWERGNSMPDISKLEQLCNVLHITIYELLGSDDRQARTVSQLLSEEQLPEAEEVAAIAPIVPPGKLKEAVCETAKKRPVKWEAIMRMAPFLDARTLDEILEKVEPEDYRKIADLAPFLRRETLDRLVSSCEAEADRELIFMLAPFLTRETLEKLVLRYDGVVDKEMTMRLAPFLGKESLDKLVFRCEDVDMELASSLAPFLCRETLDRLVEALLEKGNTEDLTPLYPFLGRDTMRKLARIMMENGDFDAMKDAAPFL